MTTVRCPACEKNVHAKCVRTDSDRTAHRIYRVRHCGECDSRFRTVEQADSRTLPWKPFGPNQPRGPQRSSDIRANPNQKPPAGHGKPAGRTEPEDPYEGLIDGLIPVPRAD